MLRTLVAGLAIGTLLLPPGAVAGQDAADLIASVRPAVVNIAVVAHETTAPVAGNMMGEPTATDRSEEGSGFFVTPGGMLVTNRHAIAGASEIFATLEDGTKLRACVVVAAEQSDIALLRVNAGRPMPTLRFGDSDRLRPGDPVFVIGNPLGHGSTVTGGIVSALGRNSSDSGFSPFLQIDASVNHGSSGAPVFDGTGDVVGIATALYSPAGETGSVGLGLAIPGSDAKFVVERLLAEGKLRLGWIGARIEPVTEDLARAVGLPAVAGSMVTDVQADSPAARAGVVAGDVVQSLDGEATAPEVLNRTLAGRTIGSVAKLGIWRAGAASTVSVVIGAWPEEKTTANAAPAAACQPALAARRDLGLTLVALTGDVRGRLGLAAQAKGVQVADVAANSVAADRGMAAGSVIVNVQQRPVGSAAEVWAGIDASRAAGRGFVLLLVRDGRGLRWVALPV